VWKPSVEEKIGITLKKKFLRESPGRNRIKRLVREAYRRDKERWKDKSIHILGKPGLGDVWKKLTLEDVKRVLETVVRKQGTSTES
jgi:ribonuclease P protein component